MYYFKLNSARFRQLAREEDCFAQFGRIPDILKTLILIVIDARITIISHTLKQLLSFSKTFSEIVMYNMFSEVDHLNAPSGNIATRRTALRALHGWGRGGSGRRPRPWASSQRRRAGVSVRLAGADVRHHGRDRTRGHRRGLRRLGALTFFS